MNYFRIFTLFALIFVGGAAVKAQPRVSSNKETHSFGQIEWKRPVTVEYTITNTGDKPLVLTNVTTSCACSVASWTQTPIAPGEKGFISASFDAKALGRFQKTIGVYSNALPELIYLKFTGEVVKEVKDFTQTHPNVIGDIRTDFTEIAFPDVSRGEQPTLTLSVVNLSDRPYEPVLMHLPPYLKMEKSDDVLLKGKKGTIKLTLDSEQLTDLGLTQTSVYLARFAGDKVNEENEIPVSAVLLPDFSQLSLDEQLNAPAILLSESTIDFSNRLNPMGHAKLIDRLKQKWNRLMKKNKYSRSIIISNAGRDPLHISKLQVFNPAVGVSLRKSVLQAGESTKLRVTILKNHKTNQKRRLRVLMITNDPGQPKVEINLKR